MKAIAPPPASPLLAVDDGGQDRLRLRLKQLSWTTVTVGATAWFCTLGPIHGILALCIAKHILVAILVMGIGLDQRSNEN
jgi:hypothetical protein